MGLQTQTSCITCPTSKRIYVVYGEHGRFHFGMSNWTKEVAVEFSSGACIGIRIWETGQNHTQITEGLRSLLSLRFSVIRRAPYPRSHNVHTYLRLRNDLFAKPRNRGILKCGREYSVGDQVRTLQQGSQACPKQGLSSSSQGKRSSVVV